MATWKEQLEQLYVRIAAEKSARRRFVAKLAKEVMQDRERLRNGRSHLQRTLQSDARNLMRVLKLSAERTRRLVTNQLINYRTSRIRSSVHRNFESSRQIVKRKFEVSQIIRSSASSRRIAENHRRRTFALSHASFRPKVATIEK